jgi:hypothetical protein
MRTSFRLVEDVKDISPAEITARLAVERGLTACPATIWYFLDKRGVTQKKDGASQRAAARGCESRPAEGGSKVNSTSIRNASSSSMRPALPPSWPA